MTDDNAKDLPKDEQIRLLIDSNGSNLGE